MPEVALERLTGPLDQSRAIKRAFLALSVSLAVPSLNVHVRTGKFRIPRTLKYTKSLKIAD